MRCVRSATCTSVEPVFVSEPPNLANSSFLPSLSRGIGTSSCSIVTTEAATRQRWVWCRAPGRGPARCRTWSTGYQAGFRRAADRSVAPGESGELSRFTASGLGRCASPRSRPGESREMRTGAMLRIALHEGGHRLGDLLRGRDEGGAHARQAAARRWRDPAHLDRRLADLAVLAEQAHVDPVADGERQVGAEGDAA